MLPLRFPNSGIRAKGQPPAAPHHPQWRSPAVIVPVGRPTNQVATGGDTASPQGLPPKGNSAQPRATIASGSQHHRMCGDDRKIRAEGEG
ncbi:hypothetical protein GW17_00048806 [Ensete ventricosum]|nr:hypothetical protein GW17_00048806 [Ensete ventricosum]